jgi:hypothetical protein
MKTRITLTIDPAISHRAKQLARQRNTSVSGLVEQFLRDATAQGPSVGKAGAPPFSVRWAGKLKLAVRNSPRNRKLRSKYLK